MLDVANEGTMKLSENNCDILARYIKTDKIMLIMLITLLSSIVANPRYVPACSSSFPHDSLVDTRLKLNARALTAACPHASPVLVQVYEQRPLAFVQIFLAIFAAEVWTNKQQELTPNGGDLGWDPLGLRYKHELCHLLMCCKIPTSPTPCPRKPLMSRIAKMVEVGKRGMWDTLLASNSFGTHT